MLEAIKQTYGDFAQDKNIEEGTIVETHVEGISLAKMETFLYGIREVEKVMNQIESYKKAATHINEMVLREGAQARVRRADL